jgi:tripartite-type tricarboxylate transporter receptor subunit TctC
MPVLLGILAAMLLLTGVAPSMAQGYPNRPVRVVVGFPPGGPTDVIARLVAQTLSDRLGQQFFVENIGGAGGNTAAGQVARVTPDGYTIMAISTGFLVNPQPVRQGAVRSDQGFLCRDFGCGFAERRGGQPVGFGQDAAGACAADPG